MVSSPTLQQCIFFHSPLVLLSQTDTVTVVQRLNLVFYQHTEEKNVFKECFCEVIK